MNDLNSYQKRKELLCSWYDRILEQAELLQPDTDVLREKRWPICVPSVLS